MIALIQRLHSVSFSCSLLIIYSPINNKDEYMSVYLNEVKTLIEIYKQG